MTGIFLRTKRNGKDQTFELEDLTDLERINIFSKKTKGDLIDWINIICKVIKSADPEKEEKMTFILQGYEKSKTIFLDGKRLDPERSQKLRNHSPDGFSWGYAGSGPAQLALAILLELTDQATALKECQNFKNLIISKLNGDFYAKIQYIAGVKRGVIIDENGNHKNINA